MCVCVCVYMCVCVCVQCMCVCTDILQGIGSLASTATRAEWEKAFDKTYIQPVVQVCTVQVIRKCPDVLSVLLGTDSTTVRSTVGTTVHSTVSTMVHSTVSTMVHSTVSTMVHSTVSTYVRYASKKSVRTVR